MVSFLIETRLGFVGLLKESTIRNTADALPDRIAWVHSAHPCGHGADKNEWQNEITADLEMQRARNFTLDNFTLDNDYLAHHWAESLDAVPVANGRLIHVHHVCVKGGNNGLVVPHFGGLINAMGYMDRAYFPKSAWPVAFREFTFEELLALFGTTGDREKHSVKHVNATLVRNVMVQSPYVRYHL